MNKRPITNEGMVDAQFFTGGNPATGTNGDFLSFQLLKAMKCAQIKLTISVVQRTIQEGDRGDTAPNFSSGTIDEQHTVAQGLSRWTSGQTA